MEKIVDNQFLEFESCPVKVRTAGELVSVDFKTKIEHDKIVGVLCMDTNSVDSSKGLFQIEIEGQKIIAQEPIHKFLIQKNSNLSVSDSAKKLDISVNTSDVRVTFRDQNTTVPINGYYVYFYFLVTKRKR